MKNGGGPPSATSYSQPPREHPLAISAGIPFLPPTINPREHPQLIVILERLVLTTPPNSRVFPYTIEQYRQEIKDIEKVLGTNFNFSPHSPRAGFASEARARGMSFVELREAGRWVADSSLRVYIDLVTAASISVTLRSKGLLPALTFAAQRALDYFSLEALATIYDTRFRKRK